MVSLFPYFLKCHQEERPRGSSAFIIPVVMTTSFLHTSHHSWMLSCNAQPAGSMGSQHKDATYAISLKRRGKNKEQAYAAMRSDSNGESFTSLVQILASEANGPNVPYNHCFGGQSCQVLFGPELKSRVLKGLLLIIGIENTLSNEEQKGSSVYFKEVCYWSTIILFSTTKYRRL